MRIAFDGTALRPGRTGVGYYSEHLLHELARTAIHDELIVVSNRAIDTTAPLPSRVRVATPARRVPRLVWVQTPHVPHGWDAGLFYEESTSTLLCGDLFTSVGSSEPLTEHEITGPALAAEDYFGATCLTPSTAPTLRRLAELEPATLGLMHGPSYNGDCAEALRDLADAYEERLHAGGVRLHAPATPAD